MGAGIMVAAAAQMNAMKAQGVIVQVPPDVFLTLLDRITEPLVLRAEVGLINRKKRYLVSYKGLAFYTDSEDKLPMLEGGEVMDVKRIWVPDQWS